MKRTPLPITDGCYRDDTRSFSVQDCVNYLPVNAEQAGTRSASLLLDAPGLVEVVRVGDGPHRCGINVGGKRLVVSGDTLYQINADLTVLIVGTIPGNARVSATANQANQVAFATGSAGYVLDTSTMVLTQITDSAFPGAILFDYINQLGVSLDPNRQYFRNSDINDLSAYSALEKYQGEASPDLLVAIKVCHSELLAFSQTTTEVFDNTTDPSSIAYHILFVNKKITIQRGCASPYCVVNLDNSVFFVGDDGSVYWLDGYTPQRISTFPIEQALARSDLSKCFAFTWEDRGHKVYYLTCPDGLTFGYDVASRKWHRRQSYNLNRWRLNTLFEWNGDWYGGSYNDGWLYRLDWDVMLDGPHPHVRERTLGVLHANQNPVICKSLELVVDTGGPQSEYVAGIIPVPEVSGTIYITCSHTTGPSYYTIDAQTNEIIHTSIDIGPIWQPILSLDGTKLYVDTLTDLKTGYVTLATDIVTELTAANVDAGASTGQMVIDSTQTYAYAANFIYNILFKIRLSDGVAVDSDAVIGPVCCVLNTAETLVYTGYAGGYAVYTIATGALVTHDFTDTGAIRAMALDPNDQTALYVVAKNNVTNTPYVFIYNTAANTLTDQIELDSFGDDIAFHPDGSVFAVCDFNDAVGSVWIYRTSDNALLHTVATGKHDRGVLRWHPNGHRLYSVNKTAGTLSVIETEDYTVVATVVVPTSPSGIWIDA